MHYTHELKSIPPGGVEPLKTLRFRVQAALGQGRGRGWDGWLVLLRLGLWHCLEEEVHLVLWTCRVLGLGKLMVEAYLGTLGWLLRGCWAACSLCS